MQLTHKLAAYAAGRKLHWIILIGVLHAPMSFFDTTPVGRVINRFTKDIDSVDTALPNAFSQALITLITVVATLIILIYGSWFAIVEFLPLAILFGYIQVSLLSLNICFSSIFCSVFMLHLPGNFVVLIRLHVVQFLPILVRQFKVLARFELIMHNNVSLMHPTNSWTGINLAI